MTSDDTKLDALCDLLAKIAARATSQFVANQCKAAATAIRELRSENSRLREIAARLDQPCPFVITADEGTAHCALAEKDAKDAERFRKLGEWVAFGSWSVAELSATDAWGGRATYYIDDLDDLRQSIDQERAVNARAAKKEEK